MMKKQTSFKRDLEDSIQKEKTEPRKPLF